MRAILFSVLVLMFVALLSCDKPVEETQYQFPIIELNHCGGTIINGQIVQICFDSVRDGRCPINAECVWAGEAIVNLSMKAGGQNQTFKMATLNAIAPFKNDTTILGYRIKLLSLLPLQGDNSSPYRVELSVSR